MPRMLYEFHRKQNAKKPGSVHATYLITGTRRFEAPVQTNGTHSQNNEDTVMQSSPFLPSSSVPKPDESMQESTDVRSILLVKEEDLEQAKSTFGTISSIHIYSLESNGLSDIQVLTECNRKISANYASEDPLQAWRQYGTIQNPNVKRRTKGTALPPPPAPVARDAQTKAERAAPAATKPAVIEKTSKEEKTTSEPDKKSAATKPASTKRQKSDIFKSFAKGNTKPKQESQGSAAASPAAEPEDEAMGGFSEDEADVMAADEAGEEVQAPTGKSKKEREADLRAMMDQDDSPMEDAAPTPAEESQEPETTIDKAESEKEGDEPKETVTLENGSRRGRRRVMKKKTVKDEEGYLGELFNFYQVAGRIRLTLIAVTREEPAWESFSEDEPAPKKIKTTAASSVGAGSKPAAAKKSEKPGQGNIMSFFGKK